MRIVNTYKYAQQSNDWKVRKYFVEQVRRHAHSAKFDRKHHFKGDDSLKNISFMKAKYEPAMIGIGIESTLSPDRWVDVEEFYKIGDINNAVKHVLNEARDLAAQEDYQQKADSQHESVSREYEALDPSAKREGRPRWTGD